MRTRSLLLHSAALLAAMLLGQSASAQVSCSGVPAFGSCTAYASGASVVFNNTKYTAIAAIPSTRDCPPNSPYNPSSDNWWTNNGTCSTSSTATATATRTATTTATRTTTATPTGGVTATRTSTATATRTSTATATSGTSGSANYTAAYWTQGNDPCTSSGPAGSGQPWGPPTACTTNCAAAWSSATAYNGGAVVSRSCGGSNPTPTATPTGTRTATATPTKSPSPTATSGTGIIGDCGMDANGAGTGQVDYVEVYRSTYARWCVDNTYWAANRTNISKFFAFYDGAVQELITVFNTQPSLPIVVEVTTPTGGACDCGGRFGQAESVIITGDAYSGSFSNPKTGTSVPGFWGYLLTLHETINVWTGHVSGGWPTDWWADHRSPFPNSMDETVMNKIGNDQGNQTLINAAATQHERFADPSISGYDSEDAMFDNFFNQYGGFPTFSNFFKLIEGDKLQWGTVSANPSALLSEYVMSYLSLAFGTTTDLTSTFVNAGVGTKDTTIASYSVDSNAVRGIANAHCSIRAASGAGVNTSTQLSQLQTGHYQSAMASGGAQSTCPSECRWSGSQCIAKW